MATAVESPRIETATGPAPWTIAHRILFRFACAYFVLYYLPAQGHVSIVGGLPGAPAYNRMWRAMVEWTAAHVFHLSGAIAVYPRINGSGDTTLDYICNLLMLAAAAIIAAVWSILDRKRDDYRRLHAGLRIWLRYSLAATLYSYGFAKIFPLQFIPPGFNRLMESFHDFSPMGLLWTFMGYSPAYTIFAGAAEALGATLLLFRRTVTLGALVSAGVLLNIVLLNFCYDVPVKLFSSNLLLTAVFLAAADFSRLTRVFVLNQPTRPLNLDAILFRSRAAWIATVALKTVFIGYFLFGQIRSGMFGYRTIYHRPRPTLYGIWQVNSFLRDGQEVRESDARWKLLLIDLPQAATVRLTDDSTQPYTVRYDAAANRIVFVSKPDLTFTFARADDSHATLEGDHLSLKLERIDPARFLINSRGFHWINERPFNR